MSNDEAMKIALERMIDERGLTFVVDSIIEVCYEKADHIRGSYGDESLASQWGKAGLALANPQGGLTDPFPT
jgi:hypothetical protein